VKVFLIELDFKIIITQTNPFRISVRLFLDTFKALKPEMNPCPTLNSAARGDRNYCRLIRKERWGIESRWGRDFRPIQPPVQWVPGLSRG
jgi:hypothetical protein